MSSEYREEYFKESGPSIDKFGSRTFRDNNRHGLRMLVARPAFCTRESSPLARAQYFHYHTGFLSQFACCSVDRSTAYLNGLFEVSIAVLILDALSFCRSVGTGPHPTL